MVGELLCGRIDWRAAQTRSWQLGLTQAQRLCAPTVLPLPNMFAAGAVYGFGWSLFDQLPFADWARFGHYVCHNLASQLG